MQVENIRNIGIIAHIDAGKTSLSERILFYTQKIDRMGEVHNGTATMDYMPEEQERGITISAACTSCNWKNMQYNLIDTPGHVDFTIEVERSLRVLDSVVAVFCALSGVEAQSETVWRQSEKFKVPKLVFINKIDRIGADFANCIKEIRTRLKAPVQPITVAYQKDDRLCIVNLIDEEILYFSEENQGKSINVLEQNEEDRIFIQENREKLLENIADLDSIFLEQYLNNTYTKEDIHNAIQRQVMEHSFIPAFAGSALKNIGVQPLLDAIGQYLPSPKQREIQAHNPDTGKEILLHSTNSSDCTALVFKVAEIKKQRLAFLRIYSGSIALGDKLLNVHTNKYEEIEELFIFHANEREEISSASAGEIVGIKGLIEAKTGDTYTKGERIILENIVDYQPVISIVLESRTIDDEEAIQNALARFCLEDPSLQVRQEEATGHFILSGMGELHLEIFVERLKREYRLEPRVGQVQVIYRERFSNSTSARGEVLKEFGEISHHGDISLTVSSQENLKGANLLRFTCDTKGISDELLEVIYQEGNNFIALSPNGCVYQDLLLEIDRIEVQENTSVAGMHMAFKEAIDKVFKTAKIEKLEPIMFVEITIAEEFLGNSLAILAHINAKVENVLDTSTYEMKKIHARATLSSLMGFATSLRSATQGRAGLSIQFDSYENIR